MADSRFECGHPARVATVTTAVPSLDEGDVVQLSVDELGRLRTTVSGGASGGTSSTFGDPFPTDGTAVGFDDGTDMQGARVHDLDSDPGTEFNIGVSLRKAAAGGSVVFGTLADPIRVDPTGTTVQPVSGSVSITPDTPTNPASVQVTASVAPGVEVDLTTAELGGKKLWKVTVWCPVPYRARIFLVNNGAEAAQPLAVGGGNASDPWEYLPPSRDFAALGSTAGLDAFRVEIKNLDASNTEDAYAVFNYADN